MGPVEAAASGGNIVTTILAQLVAAADATEARRRAGQPMTFAAGRLFHQHAVDLVAIASTVGDFLAGDVDRDALARALAPLLEPVRTEAAAS